MRLVHPTEPVRGRARVRLPRKLALAAAALVLALAAAEIAVRVSGRADLAPLGGDEKNNDWKALVHRPSSVPGLDYELVPNLDTTSREMHIRTNSIGQRDDEPLPGDAPGLWRIAALGDSITFAFHVEPEEGFASLLERRLNDTPLCPGRRADIVNFGVSGYSTPDEVAQFAAKGLPLGPDLVLLEYCLNDPETEPIQPLPRFFARTEWWERSALLRWIGQTWRRRQMSAAPGEDYMQALHRRDHPGWRAVEGAFAELRGLVEPRGIPVVVAIFPMLTPKAWPNYPYESVHAQVAELARANGFLAVDLFPLFAGRTLAEVAVSDDDPHPNALGHQLAADGILAFLRAHPELCAAH
jgi:lysophospholipase L1-like esterase